MQDLSESAEIEIESSPNQQTNADFRPIEQLAAKQADQ